MSLGCERILAFGGDGTFRAVAEALLGVDVRLGLVATGIKLEGPDYHETVSAYTMTISNVAVTGAHLPLAPDADIRDPQLYPNVYRSLGPMGTLRTGIDLARKRAVRPEFVSRHPFMRGRISGSEPLHVHADGSLIGMLPIEVESIPNAIQVVVPEPVNRSATATAVNGAHQGLGAPTVMDSD